MARVAKWERSRNRHGLWVGLTRIAYIGKEYGANRWHYSVDLPPYLSGTQTSLLGAKLCVLEEVKRLKDAVEAIESDERIGAWD